LGFSPATSICCWPHWPSPPFPVGDGVDSVPQRALAAVDHENWDYETRKRRTTITLTKHTKFWPNSNFHCFTTFPQSQYPLYNNIYSRPCSREMPSRPNDSDAVDPTLLRALIFANAEMQLKLGSRDPNTASISSLTTHHPRDLSCLTSPNPHPWSHIRRKHHRIRSRRQFTQPHDALDVPINPGPARYQSPPASYPTPPTSNSSSQPEHAQDTT
jgi:hypothetical protein